MPFVLHTNTSVLAGQCGNPQPQTAAAVSPLQPGLTFSTAAEQIIISPQGPFRSLTGCSTYDPREEHGLQIFLRIIERNNRQNKDFLNDWDCFLFLMPHIGLQAKH